MKKRILGISLIASALLADSVVQIAPVSVTATGVDENVIEQPLSIATKDEKEIKLDQVIYQKDLLNSLSGVRIEQTGSVIGHMTSIRMPMGTGPYYLFMQDGIPVQSSGFFNHNGLAYTTYQSASSVEVLKGAGTALYGSDAVAAVINVESAKKPSKTQEIFIKGMGGSYGYITGGVEASDTLDKDNAYRANASYMHSKGWRDHTKADRAEANIRYDHTFNDDNDVKVLFNFSKTDAEQADSFNDYANIENGSTAASDDPNYFTALQKTDVKRKFDYAKISAEFSNYSYNDLEITMTPYIRYNRNRYIATWEKNLPSNDNELYTLGFLQRNTYEKNWGKVIFGFDSEYTKSSLKYNQDFNVTTTGWGATTYTKGALYDYDVDYFAIAPYVHVDYMVTDTLKLSPGLRYDYNSYDYTNNLAQNSQDSSGTYYRPANRKDSYNHLSPKLALSYMPQRDLNLYIRYANGFRIPQATRLYSVKVGYENINLDAEKSNTYEIGLKKSFSNKSFLELAAYYMTIDDTIVRDSATGGYRNGGASIHKGIEASLRSEITKEFETSISYSYSKHNYDNDPTFGNNEISGAPNTLANARLFYLPKYLKGLTAMAEWQYVGSYWMDDAHTVNKYNGYSIGNLKANYVYSKKLRIFTKVTNFTDKKYAVNARYAYGKEDYTPADPRSFYAGIEYKW
ncbi:TonB-dependent receptor [Sulfurimonas paralvinellae]|uniref:TonB-dependent receptor n=1 Tax=Sulfurimonas paralvinellae TaxID=317658 RepID=A0A7M1B6F2_9BACT|nr:TonB-dependent receptor [Sulfurimonas paralvinellae]QOP45250.1 TonB-dependent receptor [Sulfurimonas paralvinellae]